jgi:hypothetical protein
MNLRGGSQAEATPQVSSIVLLAELAESQERDPNTNRQVNVVLRLLLIGRAEAGNLSLRLVDVILSTELEAQQAAKAEPRGCA